MNVSFNHQVVGDLCATMEAHKIPGDPFPRHSTLSALPLTPIQTTW